MSGENIGLPLVTDPHFLGIERKAAIFFLAGCCRSHCASCAHYAAEPLQAAGDGAPFLATYTAAARGLARDLSAPLEPQAIAALVFPERILS